ncbi:MULTISPECIES: hypothetical protein [Rhodomicrobium]|uniref:hypothetical protein n=1 Tax=Rhodomicrobium TaxID=1068 RepID=UPI000B4B94A0|nr:MULTISPECIES: hypothetical protein [Rhodomicrobium]
MTSRIEAELALLRQHYALVDHLVAHAMYWFQVHGVKTPGGWSPGEISAVFAVTQGHPGAPPYGFFVPSELNLSGKQPAEHQAPHQPPFAGSWRFLSWNAEGWHPTADLATGSNLWGWVRTFAHRLREGV